MLRQVKSITREGFILVEIWNFWDCHIIASLARMLQYLIHSLLLSYTWVYRMLWKMAKQTTPVHALFLYVLSSILWQLLDIHTDDKEIGFLYCVRPLCVFLCLQALWTQSFKSLPSCSYVYVNHSWIDLKCLFRYDVINVVKSQKLHLLCAELLCAESTVC